MAVVSVYTVALHPFDSTQRLIGFKFDPEAVDVMRSLGARWDKARRAWLVQAWALPAAEAELRSLGFRKAGETVTSSSSAEWAKALFASMPARFAEPVYKALVRVLHPDVGGDTRLAQQLNDAYRAHSRRAS